MLVWSPHAIKPANMSSRRARIKPVATLPARRRNADDRSKPPVVAAPGSSPAPAPSPGLSDKSEVKSSKSPRVLRGIKVKTPLLLSRENDLKLQEPESTIKLGQQSDSSTEVDVLKSSPRNFKVSVELVESPAVITGTQYEPHKILNIKVVSSVIETGRSQTTPQIVESGLQSPAPIVEGIVPLQSARAKTIELLKNELTVPPESAEVLFDPIVPLPSPSKIRPKLRPVPRLAPVRRNSVQGSASESEDEHKRSQQVAAGALAAPGTLAVGTAVGRIRHDSQSSQSTLHSLPPHPRDSARTRNLSVCSAMSHPTAAPSGSPLKEKHLISRSKRNESSRQINVMRRKYKTSFNNVNREKLTMYDLIFYNPTTNPIVETEEERSVKEKNAKVESFKCEEEKESTDDAVPPPVPPGNKEPEQQEQEEEAGEEELAAPVPQIKLGPNGEIILDEKSLVIETTEVSSRRLSASVVHETDWSLGGTGRGGKYTRAPRTKEWSDSETVRFYRALAAVGTDFSLMLSLFPGRSRRDLKIKFKKEERLNGPQIDKALVSSSELNMEALEEVFTRERREAVEREQRAEGERLRQMQDDREHMRRAKEQRNRLARATKSLVSILPSDQTDRALTADHLVDVHERTLSQRRLAKEERAQKRKSGQPVQHPPDEAGHIAPAPKVPISPNLNGPHYRNTVIKNPIRGSPNHQKDVSAINPLVKNAQAGSLVCLTIPDPNNPKKNILQTYVTGTNGQLTPISLPPALLGNVMDYMKNNSPKRLTPSPFTSPASASSYDSRKSNKLVNSPLSVTPGPRPASRELLIRQDRAHIQPLQRVLQPSTSPTHKRVRHDSYTITNL